MNVTVNRAEQPQYRSREDHSVNEPPSAVMGDMLEVLEELRAAERSK